MAYIDVLMNVWSMAEYSTFEAVKFILCIAMNWIAYCLYWRMISNEHIEKCKLTAVSKFEDKLLNYACGTLRHIFQ